MISKVWDKFGKGGLKYGEYFRNILDVNELEKFELLVWGVNDSCVLRFRCLLVFSCLLKWIIFGCVRMFGG